MRTNFSIARKAKIRSDIKEHKQRYAKQMLLEKTEVKTNADRIRSMSDEELAKKLVYEMCNYCYEHRTEKCYRNCAYNMLEWLKQPAE